MELVKEPQCHVFSLDRCARSDVGTAKVTSAAGSIPCESGCTCGKHSPRYTVKSCGNAHIICAVCDPRPEGDKLVRYTVKSCGKAHARCAVCDPVGTAKIAAAAKTGFNKGKKHTNRKRPSSFTDEHREAIAAARRGKPGNGKGYKWTDEQRANLSRVRKENPNNIEQFFAYQQKGRAAARWSKHSPTKIHRALMALLDALGYDYEAERRFGRFSVDCYVPELNCALEADGERWHRMSPEQVWRDRRRDQELVETHGLAFVSRFTEMDLFQSLERDDKGAR